jgi:hypothetical protein
LAQPNFIKNAVGATNLLGADPRVLIHALANLQHGLTDNQTTLLGEAVKAGILTLKYHKAEWVTAKAPDKNRVEP